MIDPPLAALRFSSPHWGEFLPPLIASLTYGTLYARRLRTLRRQGRAPGTWRVVSFATGIAFLTAVQIGPADSLGDQMLAFHMLQHIVIGSVCSLLLVLGLTGPMLQPLLRIRVTRRVRSVSYPVAALALWATDLYAWHVPLFYQLAIRHDLVHALEHACLLWFGTLLWLALIGPLPKPAWFTGWGQVGYIVLVRFFGAVLANVLIWAQIVLYPVYRSSDAARGLSPLSDQNAAGGIMLLEQAILTTTLLGWLFYRVALRDEQRQSIQDFAAQHGVSLSPERARRAALAQSTDHLRARILAGQDDENPSPAPGQTP